MKSNSTFNPNSDTSDVNCHSYKGVGYTDDVVAKQLYSLSFQDRNNINEEIHGVKSMSPEETPELIENSLKLLAMELYNLPFHYKLIYGKACCMRTNEICEDDSIEDIDTDNEDFFLADDLFLPHLPPVSSLPTTSSSSFCYVKSRDFQLTFLRCELFNAKKAAIRLAKYLELAYELYGEDALRRPLRIDDLNTKEDLEVLNAGHQQLLPFRDRSGRRVLALRGDLSLSKGPAMKLLLYLWSVLMEDVDAQRKGLVLVFWPRHVDNPTHSHLQQGDEANNTTTRGTNNKNAKRIKRKMKKCKNYNNTNDDGNNEVALIPDDDSRSTGKRFFEAIPIRMCALHFCLPNTPFFQMIRHVSLLILGDNYRTRVKTHQGDGTEILYSLMGYGIPVDMLPIDEVTQTVKTKNQAQFVNVRRKIEAEQDGYGRYNCSGAVSDDSSDNRSTGSDNTNKSSMIECPSLNDVIFRSGKSYMSHPGNMTFRGLIEKHINEHNTATQDRKKKLTWQVVDEVELKGGRFLEYDRGLGTWTELIDRSVIRHKIATYFKEYRRKVKAHQQTQINKSGTHKFKAQVGRKRKRASRCLPESIFSNM